MRTVRLLVPALFVLPFLPSTAQTPVPPRQEYSVVVSSRATLESMFSGVPSDVKVYRIGSREEVDAEIPAQNGQPEVRIRRWFDLDSHRVYTIDFVRRSCSWMTYTPAGMAENYDPLAVPQPSPADLAKLSQAPLEPVNGIPARVLLSKSEMGKTKTWYAVNGNFPLRMEVTGADGKPTVLLEVKYLRFGNVPPAMMNLPPRCDTQAQGVWDENGISAHAETTIDVNASGSADLKTGKTTGSATVQQKPAPPQ